MGSEWSTGVAMVASPHHLGFPHHGGKMIQRLDGIPWTAMTFGLIYVLGLIVLWFLPETKGKPLAE